MKYKTSRLRVTEPNDGSVNKHKKRFGTDVEILGNQSRFSGDIHKV
jgi:hypothetical protein